MNTLFYYIQPLLFLYIRSTKIHYENFINIYKLNYIYKLKIINEKLIVMFLNNEIVSLFHPEKIKFTLHCFLLFYRIHIQFESLAFDPKHVAIVDEHY